MGMSDFLESNFPIRIAHQKVSRGVGDKKRAPWGLCADDIRLFRNASDFEDFSACDLDPVLCIWVQPLPCVREPYLIQDCTRKNCFMSWPPRVQDELPGFSGIVAVREGDEEQHNGQNNQKTSQDFHGNLRKLTCCK